MAGTVGEEREMMCSDLQDVLHGRVPRAYGAPSEASAAKLGNDSGRGANGASYELIAPSALYEKLLKLKRPLGA